MTFSELQMTEFKALKSKYPNLTVHWTGDVQYTDYLCRKSKTPTHTHTHMHQRVSCYDTKQSLN